MACFLNIANLIIQALIAIGTIGALFAALHQIKKSKEQFDAEYKEKMAQLERKQANHVATWFDSDRFSENDLDDSSSYILRKAVVVNGNALPIYNVIVSVVSLHGAGPSRKGEDNENDYPCRLLFHEIVPGTWGAKIRTYGSGMHLVTTLEIAFTDTLGQNWIRRGDGALVKIEKSTLDYYKIPRPVSWDAPFRIN